MQSQVRFTAYNEFDMVLQQARSVWAEPLLGTVLFVQFTVTCACFWSQP